MSFMSFARSRVLFVVAVVAAWAVTPALAQPVPEAQLGQAPRITDLREFEASRPESGVVLSALAVDPYDRGAVIDFYKTIYLPAIAVPNDWTGSIAGCVAGQTSAAYAQATFDAVNYFRAMVQLPPVVENTSKSAMAQQAALMMSANNDLDHTPPPDWRCYSAEGAEAAGSSNLAFGITGARAVGGYIEDFGTGNEVLGHRRWILYPRQVEMGTGSTSNANSLWVIGDFGSRPPTPEFVAWPPAGYVPFPLVFPRWSFSVNTASSVNFSGAAVRLTRGGLPVTVNMLPLANGYGDNTIAWEPVGLTFRAGMADQDISVEVQNVIVGGVAKSYRYTVTVVDPVATAPPACSFAVAPRSISALASGALATIQVTASQPTCAWTALVTSGAPWLSITGQAGGVGSGSVSFHVDANTGPARTGRLSVAGQVVDVSQQASAPVMRTLTVIKQGSGTVAGSGLSCGSTCATSVADGTPVTLAATPLAGFVFTGWSGPCTGAGTCSFTMSASTTTVVATFSAAPTGSYALLVSKAGSGTGRVTGGNGAIDCGATCGAAFAPGSSVTLTASPAAGSTFLGWSGAGCSGDGPCTITMTSARSVTATFGLEAAPSIDYYLAEGATSIFDVDIAVANPNPAPAPVQLRFLLPDGGVKVHTDTIPATSRRTYRVGALPGLDLANVPGVSTVVVSTNGLPLLVERTMAWDKANGYGGHGGTAVGQPATRWYFGEGSQGFFDTYLLLANAGAMPANVEITFLREGGAPLTVRRDVGATSRVTLWAGEVPEIAAAPGTAFSMVVSSDVPIIAERAIYFGVAPFWSGGHESAGVPALATTWFHAEGATGPYFDEYLLIANPGAQEAIVTFTFLLEGGGTIVGRRQVPAMSRFTLDVENADSSLDIVSGDASLLKNAAVSTKVESTVPIVSERAMYWPHAFTEWFEAHNSFGVTQTATRWGLAEGRVGGDRGYETYILLANPTAQDARVRVTYLRSNGSTIVRELTVAANSRFNEYANSVSGLSNEEFGVVVESTNRVPIAVERAMYWNALGQIWAAGTNAVGTRLP